MRNKDGLDEMQRARHTEIGSQMFVVLLFALLLDVVLCGWGIRWLEHPNDTMVIVVACSGVYLVRLMLAGAYRSPEIKKSKATVVTLVAAMAVAFLGAIFLPKLPVDIGEISDGIAAYLLVGMSMAGLLGAWVASVIRKRRDENEPEE